MCVLWGLHVLEREGMGVDELCEMFSALFAGKVVDVLLDGGAEQGGLGDVVQVCPCEEGGVEHLKEKK